MTFFEECIQRQIDNDRNEAQAHGYQFQERTIACFTMGDYIRAVLAIDNDEDARSFYEADIANIQARIDSGDWKNWATAQQAVDVNIGWCFGEGMKPERIEMWQRVTSAARPVFGKVRG